jgi:hypothetical protein
MPLHRSLVNSSTVQELLAELRLLVLSIILLSFYLFLKASTQYTFFHFMNLTTLVSCSLPIYRPKSDYGLNQLQHIVPSRCARADSQKSYNCVYSSILSHLSHENFQSIFLHLFTSFRTNIQKHCRQGRIRTYLLTFTQVVFLLWRITRIFASLQVMFE